MKKKTAALLCLFALFSCSVKKDFDYVRDTVKDMDQRLIRVEEIALTLDSVTSDVSHYQRENDAYYLQNLQNINMKIDALRQALQLSKSQLDALTLRMQNMSDTDRAASEAAFERAMVDYSKGDYDLAEIAFSDFLASYPASAKIADALFYLAESQFSQNKYEAAFGNYSLFRANYPMNPSMPAVLYKSGLCKKQSGDMTSARGFFQDLIDAYPDSREADWAKDQIR
ncbi:tetratricopeptide repeat protein [candidate division WOR-3 bacterium]|nr:tetratricopeptide repeat protein [candidate division WOR-3 bacterium]